VKEWLISNGWWGPCVTLAWVIGAAVILFLAGVYSLFLSYNIAAGWNKGKLDAQWLNELERKRHEEEQKKTFR
jgi:hypothetical protein